MFDVTMHSYIFIELNSYMCNLLLKKIQYKNRQVPCTVEQTVCIYIDKYINTFSKCNCLHLYRYIT